MLVAWVPTILILLFFLFLAWMQSDAADPSGAPDNEDNDTNGSNSRKTSIAGRYQNNFNLSDLLSFFVISSSSKVPESRHRGRRGQDALHPGGALPRRRRTRLLLRHRDHGNQPSHDLIDIGHNLHRYVPDCNVFHFPPQRSILASFMTMTSTSPPTSTPRVPMCSMESPTESPSVPGKAICSKRVSR